MRDEYRTFMEEHVYPAERALAREDEAADEVMLGLRARAGADPTGLQTRADLDGDEWVIDGHKWFSSGAEGAGFGIVMAVTEPEAEPHRRMSQILVPADSPGLRIEPVPVSGHRGRGWSTHCEVWYSGVRVPASNLLGERGDGFRIAQKR